MMGKKTLMALGFRTERATRAANLFRAHDQKVFNKLAPVAGEEERFILAARDAQNTMDRLLAADMESLGEEGGESPPIDPRLLAAYPGATETLQ